MKQCPSCQTLVQPQLAVCSNCGYSFQEEASTAKKTMMGIPGIDRNAPDLGQAHERPKRAGRNTMFGFPLQGDGEGSALGDEATRAGDVQEDDGGGDATRVVSGDIASVFDSPDFGGASITSGPSENPVRSTAPRGLPSIERDQASPGWAQLDEESSDAEDIGAATVVAPSSLFGEAIQDPREHSGFSQMRGPVHERPKKHETLMGMNINDLEGLQDKNVRNTMFSLPAAMQGAGDGLSEASEEEDDDGAPTQAISGAAIGLPTTQDEDVTREQSRKRLLEKLRNNTQPPEAQDGRAARSTMFGIPGISGAPSEPQDELEQGVPPTPEVAAQPLEPRPDEPFSARTTPHSGVLKVSRRKPNASTEGSAPSAAPGVENSGVLGSSSYMVNREEVESEQVASAPRIKPKQASLRFEVPTPGPVEDAPPEPEADRDRTQVASGDIAAKLAELKSLSSGQEGAPSAGEDQDRTQVASGDIAAKLAELKQHGRDGGGLPSFGGGGRGDSTQIADAALSEQLQESMRSFDAPGSSSTPERLPHDDSAGAPAEPPPRTGPRFAVGADPEPGPQPLEVQDFDEVPSPQPELVEPEPFSAPDVEDVPDASPSPSSLNAAQLFGDMDEEPEALEPEPFSAPPESNPTPMLEPEHVVTAPPPEAQVPREPAPRQAPQPQQQSAQAHTASPQQPTPSSQQLAPAQQQQPARKKNTGRTFQRVFGVLAALALLASTGVGFATGGMPEGPIAMVVVFAPTFLALTSLGAAFAPLGDTVRAVGLVISALAALGIFALGLTQAAFGLGLIIACVGGLFGLAAAAFPSIARAI